MPCLELREQLETALAPLVREEGLELLDLEWRPEHAGWTLRLFLDKEEGAVTLQDCERVSKKTGNWLDQSPLVQHRYSLEVSSPGPCRSLKREKDFLRFIGERVRLELKEPLEGSAQKVIVAYLKGFEEGKILLTADADSWLIPLEAMAKVHLDPEV